MTVHGVDVIVYGTGFKGTEFLGADEHLRTRRAQAVRRMGGRGCARLSRHVGAGFPNLFMMYGPNTNVGSGSIIYMMESQARYIRQAVDYLAARPGHFLAAQPAAEQSWDDWLQKRLVKTPWNFCSSWYRNASGRITNNWPGATALFRWKTKRFEPSEYAEGVAAKV